MLEVLEARDGCLCNDQLQLDSLHHKDSTLLKFDLKFFNETRKHCKSRNQNGVVLTGLIKKQLILVSSLQIHAHLYLPNKDQRPTLFLNDF